MKVGNLVKWLGKGESGLGTIVEVWGAEIRVMWIDNIGELDSWGKAYTGHWYTIKDNWGIVLGPAC